MDCPIIDESRVLKLRVSLWTRLIASFGIVGDVVILITAFVALSNPSWSDMIDLILSNMGIDVTAWGIKGETQYLVAWLLVVLCIIGIEMGFLLFTGSVKLKPRFLAAWMGYIITYEVFGFVLGIVDVFLRETAGDTPFLMQAFWVLGGLFVDAFILWVVYLHRKDMKEYLRLQESNNPCSEIMSIIPATP